MNYFKAILGVSLGLLVSVNLTADAGQRYDLKTPTGENLALTTVNQKREAESLVLYTPEYGASTRTNPYGVEIAATPVEGSKDQYRVTQITSIFDCQQETSLKACGNIAIPQNGVVLSAMGQKRALLAENFTPGSVFSLKPVLIYESEAFINSVNPTPETNPPGAPFPGYRGGNQLVIYDMNYGQETTGTNEFGYEITIKDGRVVGAEGANSVVPKEEGSYILSGHGTGRSWILNNAPIGARLELNNSHILSIVDKDTYLYQLNLIVKKIEQFNPKMIPNDLVARLNTLTEKSYAMTNEDVALEAQSLEKELTPVLWKAYPTAPIDTMRAIWHRPSETSIAEIQQSLNLIQKSGFNTIFLETYLHGDPIFPSKTMAEYHITQKLPFSLRDGNGDLFQTWLTEAHQRGMKVHVWFQTFYAGNRQYDNSWGSVLTAHPDWANIQYSGLGKTPLPPSTLEGGAYFLDPANPQVQTYLLALIHEIVTRYPIDGFQLDYIRYPASFPPDRNRYLETTWGYTTVARQAFSQQTGLDPAAITPTTNPEVWQQWNDYKTAQVNHFVKLAHQEIKSLKPNLPVSAAIFPKLTESMGRKHQNWQLWAQQGWVDFFAPMTLTSSLSVISEDTHNLKTVASVPVITGLFGPFNGNTPTDVVDQVWSAYQAGAQGIAMFDTAHLTQKMSEALHAGIFDFPQQSH